MFGISIGACLLVLLIVLSTAGLLIKLFHSRIESVVLNKFPSRTYDAKNNTRKKTGTVKPFDSSKSDQDEAESENYEIPDGIESNYDYVDPAKARY